MEDPICKLDAPMTNACVPTGRNPLLGKKPKWALPLVSHYN